MMIQRLVASVAFCSIQATSFSAPVEGLVESLDGKPVAGATVLVQDARSGIPLGPKGKNFYMAGDILGAVTGPDGKFSIDVPEGSVNLLAQRWTGETIPWKGSIGKFKIIPRYGETVELLGAAQNVMVTSGTTTSVRLTSPGNGTLSLIAKASNNDSFVLVSTNAARLDPVFGFARFDPQHVTGLVGVNRMPQGKTVFRNVPPGKLYVSAFANDNRPGFAGGEVEVQPETTGSVNLEWIARWSDARKTPPARLQPLFEKLSAENAPQPPAIKGLTKRWASNATAVLEILDDNGGPEAEIILSDGTKTTLLDYLTAAAYVAMNR